MAEKIKVEGEIKLHGLAKEKEEDLEVKKEIVELVHDQRGQAANEVEKNKADKKAVRDQMNQEITEALQRRKEEDAIELARKEELIRQIRELEKIPLVRTTGYDPTETAGQGLLNEMSMAEL